MHFPPHPSCSPNCRGFGPGRGSKEAQAGTHSDVSASESGGHLSQPLEVRLRRRLCRGLQPSPAQPAPLPWRPHCLRRPPIRCTLHVAFVAVAAGRAQASLDAGSVPLPWPLCPQMCCARLHGRGSWRDGERTLQSEAHCRGWLPGGAQGAACLTRQLWCSRRPNVCATLRSNRLLALSRSSPCSRPQGTESPASQPVGGTRSEEAGKPEGGSQARGQKPGGAPRDERAPGAGAQREDAPTL